jgi:hypothetical protein
MTVRTDKQVFLCYISPAHYNAISIAASQDGGGGAAAGGVGSAARATKRARSPERVRQDGGSGAGEGGGQEAEDEIAKHETKGEAGEREGRSESLSAHKRADKRAHKNIPPKDCPAKLLPVSSTKRSHSRLAEAHMLDVSSVVTTGVSSGSMGVARCAAAPGGSGRTPRRSLRRR